MPKEKAEQLLESLKGIDLQEMVGCIPDESWGVLENQLKTTAKEILYSYVNY